MAEGGGLLNRYTGLNLYRGFESLRLRQPSTSLCATRRARHRAPTPPRRPVRVRFAPSPTGYLHIGGVRTALFNWLFARRHGGSSSCASTTPTRSATSPRRCAPILDGFRWLGIDWDEGRRGRRAVRAVLPVAAAARSTRRRSSGCSPAATPTATTRGPRRSRPSAPRPRRRSGRTSPAGAGWPTATADRAALRGRGPHAVVRLKMPREGACRIDRPWCAARSRPSGPREDDHVIQRADGTCLYHLASVVDDVEMEITHVIRAEEHLSNTPRQIFIFAGARRARCPSSRTCRSSPSRAAASSCPSASSTST